MECEEVKKIIPRYFKHTASEDEIKDVEEHLCICHECRSLLGDLMDKADDSSQEAASEDKGDDMQIISRDDIGSFPLNEDSGEPINKEEPQVAEPQVPAAEETTKNMEYFPAKDSDKTPKKEEKPAEPTLPETPEPISDEPESNPAANSSLDPNESKLIQEYLDDMKTEKGQIVPGASKDKPTKPAEPSSVQEPTLNKEEPLSNIEPIDASDKPKKSFFSSPNDSDDLAKEPDQESAPEPVSQPEPPKEEPKMPEPSVEAPKEEPKMPEPTLETPPDPSSTAPAESLKEPEEFASPEPANLDKPKEYSFNSQPSFPLDDNPIPSDKAGMMGYGIVAAAVIILLFCVFMFLQIKG